MEICLKHFIYFSGISHCRGNHTVEGPFKCNNITTEAY